jgi:DNA-binding CsgD family transcriptional regulator
MKIQHKGIWDFVETIRHADTLVDLQSVSRRYTSQIGFEACGFAIHVGAAGTRAGYRYFQNFQEPWGSHRYERIYASDAADRDPIVAHVLAGMPPTSFNCNGVVTHSKTEFVTRSAKLMERARDFGICSGVLAPLNTTHRSWSFMLATSADNLNVRDALDKMPDFHLFAHYVHSAARVLLEPQKALPPLSARELEVLRWAAVGKTSWEMGHILGIAESTINFHLAAAAAKLQVRGRRAACSKAVLLGLIEL